MKKVSFVLCLCVFTGVTNLWAQPPDSVWSHRYSIPNASWEEEAFDVTREGGAYYVLGSSRVPGEWEDDTYLVKTDLNGNELLQASYGYPGRRDMSFCIIPDAGNLAIGGFVEEFGPGWRNMSLRRVQASNLSEIDQFAYGRSGQGVEAICWSIIKKSDSGYMLSGFVGALTPQEETRHTWVVAVDAGGNAVWDRDLLGFNGVAVQERLDGDFVIGGNNGVVDLDTSDVRVTIIDHDGNTMCTNHYGGSGEDYCNDICVRPDGGVMVAGITNSFGAGDFDWWLLSLDNDCNLEWSRTYGGPQLDWCESIEPTADGGYFLTGFTESYGAGGRDFWALRVNATGDSVWSHTFGGALNEECRGTYPTPDGGFVLAGYTGSFGALGGKDVWMVKTGAGAPYAGYVTLEIPGPMDWDYRLHWVSGSIYRLVFRNICPGTHGSCCDGASALGWHATDYPDSVVFTSPNPLTSGSLVVFRLYHPYCSDQITWVAGDSSGLIDGPLPVELMSFTAIEGDRQIMLRWETASETDNDYFEIRRDAVLVAQMESEGNSTSGHEYSWTDREVENGVTYEYTLTAVDMSGVQEEIGVLNATPQADAPTVTEYALAQNYPNPFNASTEIRYAIPEAGHVTLTVFNAMGQVVATLVDADQVANNYHVEFDASHLSTGIYLYRLEVNEFAAVNKMVLLR